MKYAASMTELTSHLIFVFSQLVRSTAGEREEILGKYIEPCKPLADLADFLKKRHGAHFQGSSLPDNDLAPSPKYYESRSANITIRFDNAVDGDKDTSLVMTWSQAARFISEHKEVFAEQEEISEEQSNEEQSKELSIGQHHALLVGILREIISRTTRKKNLISFCEENSAEDVLTWVSDRNNIYDEMDIRIDEDMYDIEFYNTKDKIEIIRTTNWNGYGSEDIVAEFSYRELADFILKNYKEIFELTDQKEPPAAVSETFNYAVLSAELGGYLKQKEQQLKNEYMNFTANCGAIFAEAQERLAKHGFGENNGIFEKWIESMGFKKKTVYNMISVHKFRSCKFYTNEEQELFDNLSKTLQYEIAKPSAPKELVDKVMSGDITTHKDYIALKKQLDEAVKRAGNAENQAKKSHEAFERVADTSAKNYEKFCAEKKKVSDLEKQIKELESRPVEVAVETDKSAAEEIEKLKQELSEARQEVLDMSFRSGITSDNDKIEELYGSLHNIAISALRECLNFVLEHRKNNEIVGRFRGFEDVLEMYFSELEEEE